MLEGFLLLYLIVVKVERPLSGYCAAWGPPIRSYLLVVDRSSMGYQSFLRSAAHERVPRVYDHSDLSPFVGSLLGSNLVLCSISAGQTLYQLLL